MRTILAALLLALPATAQTRTGDAGLVGSLPRTMAGDEGRAPISATASHSNGALKFKADVYGAPKGSNEFVFNWWAVVPGPSGSTERLPLGSKTSKKKNGGAEGTPETGHPKPIAKAALIIDRELWEEVAARGVLKIQVQIQAYKRTGMGRHYKGDKLIVSKGW